MKTYEKIEIIHNEYIQPKNLKKILLVALCSFGLGLIPIVYGLDTSKTGGVVPTEAALWQVEY
jgi:hypothetical protein